MGATKSNRVKDSKGQRKLEGYGGRLLRGLLVGCLTSQQHAIVYLRDGSAQTILCGAAVRQKLQIQLSISPNHSVLTLGQPVPALTLYRQAPVRVATGVPILKSLV